MYRNTILRAFPSQVFQVNLNLNKKFRVGKRSVRSNTNLLSKNEKKKKVLWALRDGASERSGEGSSSIQSPNGQELSVAAGSSSHYEVTAGSSSHYEVTSMVWECEKNSIILFLTFIPICWVKHIYIITVSVYCESPPVNYLFTVRDIPQNYLITSGHG